MNEKLYVFYKSHIFSEFGPLCLCPFCYVIRFYDKVFFLKNFIQKFIFFRSSQISTASDEVMYEAVAQVSSQSNAATVVKSTSSNSDDTPPVRPPPPAASKVEQALRMIPRLEDKYDVASNLDELVTAQAETRSEANSYTSSVSSKVTQQSSNYSSMSSKSMTTNKNQLQQQQTTSSSQGSMISNQSSVKTLKDSSYSTASSIASTTKTASSAENQNFGKNSEVAYSKFIDSLTRANEQ